MKKLLLLLGLLGSPAVAQETQTPTYSILYTSHVCDTYENIVSWITGEFKEEILFKGIGTAVYEDQTSYGEQDGAMQYFVNQKTESWTMIYIFEPNKKIQTDLGVGCWVALFLRIERFSLTYLFPQPNLKTTGAHYLI